MRRCSLLALAFAVLLPRAGAADPPDGPLIYKWVDENGIAHYTTDRDRIPSSLRDRIRALGRREAEPAARPTGGESWVTTDAGEAPARSAPGEVSSPAADARAGAAAGTEAQAPAPDPRTPAERADLEQRIAALEQEIERDEARMKELISDPSRAEGTGLADDPEFREVARRLPRLQADLRALRAERAHPAAGASPAPTP